VQLETYVWGIGTGDLDAHKFVFLSDNTDPAHMSLQHLQQTLDISHACLNDLKASSQ
jgi:hypothetical protein